MSSRVKIVVYVPESHADVLRRAMGEAGAGVIGDYSACSFSVKGVGRFLPEAGANPAIGEVGTAEEVEEERIEMICESTLLDETLKAIRRVHPYEEIGFDVYPIVEVVMPSREESLVI